jgi:TPR repeat protein
MAPDYGGYDPERAGQVFEQSCQQGNAKGCLWLGRLSWRGRGRPVDHERARALFRQACDAGEEAACADLGLMLELGHGGPPELLRAEAIYREGCMDSGHPQLCARLALLVVKGQPIRLDQPAVDLLSRAARSADPAGRVGLGLAWIDGLGGAAPDPERGWLLLGDACDLDGASHCDLTGCTYEEALACHVLAVREEGRPGSDPTLVQRLRRAACDNGVTDACALLEAAPAGE